MEKAKMCIDSPSRKLLTPKTKVKGMFWVFHKGDNDDHPSVPHGHSQDGKYKLELWNGNIYEVETGKLKYKAKRKEMEKLYNLPGFVRFVYECRDEYVQRNPAITLPKMTFHYYKNGRRAHVVNKTNGFVVFIRHDNV